MKLEPFELLGSAADFGDALGARTGGQKMILAKDHENLQTTTMETQN